MSPTISSLKDDEKSLLTRAPILVCLLIAGADRRIDRKEVVGFLYQIYDLSSGYTSAVSDFYSEILNSIEKRLFEEYDSLPDDLEERSGQIVKALTGLNDILPKLNKNFSASYYKSLKDTALKIAKSSGGVMGVGSISDEEKKYVDLPMINPVK